MKWVSDKPTTPWWYWWRNDECIRNSDLWCVARIIIRNKQAVEDWSLDTPQDGQWYSEPIEPPEE